MKHYGLPETAKMIKKAVQAAFPGVAFSVKSHRYSMGCSITVYWTDGPLQAQVDPIIKNFSGASFDGMIDLKSYHDSTYKGEQCKFAPDYVFSSRHISETLYQIAAYQVHKQTGLPLLEVKNGNVVGGDYVVPFVWMDHARVIVSDPNPGGMHNNYYVNIVNSWAWNLKLVADSVNPGEVPQPVAEKPFEAPCLPWEVNGLVN